MSLTSPLLIRDASTLRGDAHDYLGLVAAAHDNEAGTAAKITFSQPGLFDTDDGHTR